MIVLGRVGSFICRVHSSSSPKPIPDFVPVPWQDPPSVRKFYRREEGGLGVFGVDSEEEGDHESSYDGPDSDAEDAEAWEPKTPKHGKPSARLMRPRWRRRILPRETR